ncbi:hypothetical protein [Streptomyces albogriseolus]|uniref:hypothetical protein n=1 Tax=Streptomyces albogriseolus TaxID=1887 RepID=UPI0034607673
MVKREDREAARLAAREAAAQGLRQEWKVTFYEADEDGHRKEGGRAFTRYVTTSPFASAIPTAHAVFTALHHDPDVPEVDMMRYDIDKTQLVPQAVDEAQEQAR